MNSRHSSSAHMSSRKEGLLYAPANTLPAQPRPNSLYGSKATRSAPDLDFYSTANGGGGGGGGNAQRGQANFARYSSEWMEKTTGYPSYKPPQQAPANGTYGRTVSTNRVSTIQPVKRRPSSIQSNGESRMSITKSGQAAAYGWVIFKHSACSLYSLLFFIASLSKVYYIYSISMYYCLY